MHTNASEAPGATSTTNTTACQNPPPTHCCQPGRERAAQHSPASGFTPTPNSELFTRPPPHGSPVRPPPPTKKPVTRYCINNFDAPPNDSPRQNEPPEHPKHTKQLRLNAEQKLLTLAKEPKELTDRAEKRALVANSANSPLIAPRDMNPLMAKREKALLVLLTAW